MDVVPCIIKTSVTSKFQVIGNRNFPDWIADWILDLVARNSAIMVSADYRLLPESTGADILDDLSVLYLWVSSSLSSFVTKSRPGVEADLGHLLIVGGSAGGWCALQSYLCQTSPPQESKWNNSGLTPRAVISLYPMVHFDTLFWEGPHGPQTDAVAAETALREHLEKIKREGDTAVVTHPEGLGRMQLIIAIVRSGRLKEFLGDDAGLDPIKRLREGNSSAWSALPPLWLIHGRDDAVVDVNGSKEFIKTLSEVAPEAKAIFTTRPGDHGFDIETTFGEEWMHDGLEMIQSAWL